MKQFIPASLLLFICISCQKPYSDQQATPVLFNTDTVTETIDNEAFICMLPIEPEFPGGIDAWHQFLQQSLIDQINTTQDDLQGTVIVKFMIDTAGTVCNVEAVSGAHSLQQIAIDVLKQSPKWIPAQMAGRTVAVYKRQPIIFRLEDE